MVNISKKINPIYQKFIKDDQANSWSDFDEYMLTLDELSYDELHRETDTLLTYHKEGSPFCYLENYDGEELAQEIIESLEEILEKYKKYGTVWAKEVYIIKYYLVLSHLDLFTS